MSYIRFAWGLLQVAGASDSYIISTEDDNGKEYIDSYGMGPLGMMELICEAIDAKWCDDKVFSAWFKQRVAEKLGVELRKTPITVDQSMRILEGELDAVTLKQFSKKEKAEQNRLLDKLFKRKKHIGGSTEPNPIPCSKCGKMFTVLHYSGDMNKPYACINCRKR